MVKRTRNNKKSLQRKRSRKHKNHRHRIGGGGNTVPICIYSHSSVFDVLQIQVHYLSKLFKGAEQKLYFFLDKEFTGDNEGLTYETILYDDKIAYTKRMAYCVDKVVTPYCIVSQENDILLKYDTQAIETLANKMGEMNIDSVDLAIRDLDCEKQIQITDTLYIMNLKGGLWQQHTNLVFTVQPKLWNRQSAIKVFSSIGDIDYKGSERTETQEYVQANHNMYGFCSAQPMMSFGILSEAFPVAGEYIYIHITKDGKFVRKAVEADELHPDIAVLEKELYEKHNEPSVTRGKTVGDGTRAYAVNGIPGFFKKV